MGTGLREMKRKECCNRTSLTSAPLPGQVSGEAPVSDASSASLPRTQGGHYYLSAVVAPLTLLGCALHGCSLGAVSHGHTKSEADHLPVRPREPRGPASLEERLRSIQAFLASGGAQRCDVAHVSGHDLSWHEFGERWRGQAVVLTNLSNGSLLGPVLTREAFVEAYRDAAVKANNGQFGRARVREVITIGDYFSANASDHNIFLVERDTRLIASLGLFAAIPIFGDFNYRPILSIGSAGAPTYNHRHQETWLHLLTGRKAWWLGTGTKGKPRLPRHGDPCASLPADGSTKVEGFSLCVQHAGEVVHFGNLTPHATCNLDSFVLGVGGQGHTEGLPTLLRAARLGDLGALRGLLAGKQPADIEERDYMNRTALQHAALIGHSEALELLLHAGADLHPGEPQPLQSASEFGDWESVRTLLEAGAPWDQRDALGGTAAHYAAKGGHVQVLGRLFERRASPRAQDTDGAELLHWAAAESNGAMVDFIVAHGGNVNGKMGTGLPCSVMTPATLQNTP